MTSCYSDSIPLNATLLVYIAVCVFGTGKPTDSSNRDTPLPLHLSPMTPCRIIENIAKDG